MHPKRRELGYSNCVKCSTEEKWSGVQVVHHKTGNEIQVVKDPEVAAEFVAKSTRSGFGALKGMTGSWKRPVREVNTEPRKVKPCTRVYSSIISKKKIVTNYSDEEVGPVILDILQNEGKDEAIKKLEQEFQSLKLSPEWRKRLLFIINSKE
jgi:hypothetical protein